MTNEERSKLEEIFLAVFELDPGADVKSLQRGVTGDWDSMRHVALIGAIESEFGVEISAADSIEVSSFESADWILDDIRRT